MFDLSGPRSFVLKPLFNGGLVGADPDARLRFGLEVAELYRAVTGADRAAGELQIRLDHLMKALDETAGDTESLAQQARELNRRLQELRVSLNGDTTRSSRSEPVPLSISGRIQFILDGSWNSQTAVTPNYRDSLAVANADLNTVLAAVKKLAADTTGLEVSVEGAKAPWTPGRIPH